MRVLVSLALLSAASALRVGDQASYGGAWPWMSAWVNNDEESVKKETQLAQTEDKVAIDDSLPPQNLHALVILHSNPNNMAFLKVADCWMNRFLNVSSIKQLDIHTMDALARDHVNEFIQSHAKGSERINHIPDISESWVEGATAPEPQALIQTEAQWPSLDYMQQFFNTVLKHLEKGEDVLHSDLDAVWTKDPWPAVNRILKKHPDTSVISMTEDHTVQARGPQAKLWAFNMNTGFALFRATPQTIKMVRQLRDETLNTGMARRPHEQGALNAYLVAQNCSFANGKGEKWVAPQISDYAITEEDGPMTRWRAKNEKFSRFATAAVDHYKSFVDEDGLVGNCKEGMKIAVMDNKRFVREPNDNAIIVHPVISWNANWKADAYERLTTLVPGICPKP